MDVFFIKLDADRINNIISSSAIGNLITETSSEKDLQLELGESWCALHFILSGEPPIPKPEALKRGISWDDDSLENIIMGGSVTPFKDTFGAARYFTPEEVAKLQQELSSITEEKLMELYDPGTLEDYDIPPGNWDKDDLTWLIENFNNLKTFYESAAQNNQGLLTYVI